MSWIITNQTPFDAWTMVHVIVTLCLGYFAARIEEGIPDVKKKVVIGFFVFQAITLLFALLIIFWEVFEQRGIFEFIGCYNESTVNYVADICIGLLCLHIGYSLGSRMG